AARLVEHRDQVRARDVHVLAPEHDAARVEQRGRVAAVTQAEVELLGGFTRAAADVPALDGHGAQLLEEIVREGLQQTQRAAASIMADRGWARLGEDAPEPGGDV